MFALCTGCQVLALLMRVGILPETVRVECAGISRRLASAQWDQAASSPQGAGTG